MSTRRRFLAILGAAGLVPARALGQDAPAPEQMRVCEAVHSLEANSVAGLSLREEFELDGTPRGALARYHAPQSAAETAAPFRSGRSDGAPRTRLSASWTGGTLEALAPQSLDVTIHGLGVEESFVETEADAFARAGRSMMGFDGSVPLDVAIVFPDGHRIEESGQATRSTSDGSLFGGIRLADGAAAPAMERWEAGGMMTLEARLPGRDGVVASTGPLAYPAELLGRTWTTLAGEVRRKAADGACELQRRPADCFLTTAAVGAVGLSDDCAELRVLRAFRDGPLSRMPGGAALIADYYRTGPAIVASVSARPDARRIWPRTFVRDILSCVVLARLGLNRVALRRYRAMVARLGSRQA